MTDRTVYILGCILGRMATELSVDCETVLLNAFHNPWSEISLLHIGYFRKAKYTDQLADYMSAMVKQIPESEDITKNIRPIQQGPVAMGFELGKTFNFANQIAERRITQQQLADKLGVTRMTVSRWLKDGIPDDRRTEIELAIYSLSGTIGNGYEYITE